MGDFLAIKGGEEPLHRRVDHVLRHRADKVVAVFLVDLLLVTLVTAPSLQRHRTYNQRLLPLPYRSCSNFLARQILRANRRVDYPVFRAMWVPISWASVSTRWPWVGGKPQTAAAIPGNRARFLKSPLNIFWPLSAGIGLLYVAPIRFLLP